MKGLGELIDGSDPSDIGAWVEYDEDAERSHELYDAIVESSETTRIAWFMKPGSGRLLRLDENQRRRWRPPAGYTGVIEWTDGNGGEDPTSSLRLVNDEDIAVLLANNECVAVDRIIAHYEAHPADDGHPGGALYEIAERWRNRRQYQATTGNRHKTTNAGRAKPAGIDSALALYLGEIDWSECPGIERSPKRMSGAWYFEGTRLPVHALFMNLSSGLSIPEFVKMFPGANEEQVKSILDFLSDRLEETRTE